jgi:hypothetical protein
MKLTLVVTINGTDTNPHLRYGLRVNPFPQLGKAEYTAAERQVASLDGDPVLGPEDIRARLAGFSEEFIKLCCDRFQPGKRVRFLVTFPEER